MSILYSSVCLSEGFFLLLQHRKIAKASFFQVEQQPKKFLNCLRRAAELYNLEYLQFCWQTQENH